MSMDCQAVRDASLDLKRFIIDYRVSLILIALTIINFLLDYIQKHIVTKLSVYKHYSPETNLDIAVRFMQLILGSIVGISGYGILIFNGSTGCNASELQLFTLGGSVLVAADIHEYVRRWPLPFHLLGHHVMVFFIALSMIEYSLVPPNFNDEISWSTTLIVANIGFMWITDFFHVVFRVSTSLPLIERARRVYLICSMVRPITFCLMVYGGAENIVDGSIVGALPITFMAVAYAYNTYRAITFVVQFNCEKYFTSHQAKWAGEKFGYDILKTAIRKKRISVHNDPAEELDLLSDNERSSFGHEHNRGSIFGMLNSMLAMDVEQDKEQVQEGLRGGIAAEKDLSEALDPMARLSLFQRHSSVSSGHAE